MWHSYRAFGLTIASDFVFSSKLGEGGNSPDLYFSCVLEAPANFSRPLHSSAEKQKLGSVYLYRAEGCEIVHISQIADYYLWPDRIICHLLNPTYRYLVDVHFLGPILSLWFKRQGFAALHASAVVVNQAAVAFLASNKGGKSSLAAALMQAGYPLLTDDILLTHSQGNLFIGRPGYPQMRFWPEQAHHFLGHFEGLEQVLPDSDKRRVVVGRQGFGTFCYTSKPICCIYLPQRREPAEFGTEIEFAAVSKATAVVELVRYSFNPQWTEAAGLQAQQLAILSVLVQQLPVRRFLYPSGLQYLPQVRQELLANVALLPTPPL